MWADWRCIEQVPVKNKRMLRVRRAHPLVVTPTSQLKATRTPTRSIPRATTPNEWWGLEMTKVLVEGCGGVSSVLGWAWDPKKLVGYSAGSPCTARPWLTALALAVNRQCPAGARGQGVGVLRDHGSQPTSLAFR
jgi:hypothetical protein